MSTETEHSEPIRGAGQRCPSCGELNSILDLRCRSCGAYVRDRVPALNLFSVLWGMIESPDRTILRIARSEQKNYVHVLFALTGPVLLASSLTSAMAGDLGLPFGILLAGIFFIGPLYGLVLLVSAAFLFKALLRPAATLRLRYRDTSAFLAYALSPLMWASVILLPLQLGLFGLSLFSVNPPGWQLQPMPYWTLAGADAVALIWSILLLPRALTVFGVGYARGLLLSLPIWMFLGLCVTATALIFPVITG